MTVLDYINELVEVEGYSEEEAEVCADYWFSDNYGDDDYTECGLGRFDMIDEDLPY